MTNGHWDKRRKVEAEAEILYTEGKTEEADYLLGKQLHPDYIPVNERVTESEPVLEPIVAQTESTSWYWVKYPSGRIEYMKISESLKTIWLQKGYEISRSKIEGVSQEPELIPIPAVHIPELIPDAQLSSNVIQIINALESGKQLYPDWFNNNINWVKNGHMTEQEFLKSYYYLSEQGLIHAPIVTPIPPAPEPTPKPTPEPAPPIMEPIPEPIPEVIAEPEINDSITTNMVTQQVINFNIVNGRAIGSIRFIATNNFNAYYYGKNILSVVQFKTPNGVNILPYVKQNNLRFTETERDEIINFDEDMKGNTRATIESFVWEWIDKPAGAFSNKYSIEISETETAKPLSTGIMGAGVGGAIGILILLGFLADSRRKK